MAHTLTFTLQLGPAQTGIAASLRAQPIDTTGAANGSAIATGFVERGTSGTYLFHSTAIPDGHGGVDFYNVADATDILASIALNPQESENADAKTSTRSSHAAVDVWAVATRSLTTFGTLTTDTATAVWASGTRSLTTFGTLVADTAAAVWEIATSGLTTVGAIGTRIVGYLTGDSFARLGAPSGASISADVAGVKTDTNTTLGRLTTTRAGYLDNLNGFSISAIVTAVWASLTSAATTVGSLGKLLVDNLNATVSSRSSHAATDVWSAATRTLTASSTLSAQDIIDLADAVWDEAIAGHTTAGTTGDSLNDIIAHVTSQGTGSVTVDHDYGTAGALTFETSGGIGIDGGIIRAYLTADVTASGYSGAALRGRTTTDSNGEWEAPMYLDPGAYTLTYADSNERLVTTTTVTVSAP